MLFLSFERPEGRSETKFKHFILPVFCHMWEGWEGQTRGSVPSYFHQLETWHVWRSVCVCVCVAARREIWAKLFPAETSGRMSSSAGHSVHTGSLKMNYVIINWSLFWFSIQRCISSRGPQWDCVCIAVCWRREWGGGSLEGCAVRSTAHYQHIGIPMSGVKKARLLVETPFLQQTQSAKSPRTYFQKLLLMWACVNHPHRQLPLHPPLPSIWNSHTLGTRGEHLAV